MSPPTARTPRWWSKITRDVILFAAGLGLTVNEALLRDGPERPSLLVLFAGMMGLPAIFRFDEERERRRRSRKKDRPRRDITWFGE